MKKEDLNTKQEGRMVSIISTNNSHAHISLKCTKQHIDVQKQETPVTQRP